MRVSFLILITFVFVFAGLMGCDEETTGPDPKQTNSAPNQPTINTGAGAPTDGATDCPRSQALHWQCTDPDGDALTFDVFFGLSSPSVSVSTGQTAMTYNPGTLAYSTTYYWKVVAKDPDNATKSSAEWSFTTMAQPTETVGDPNTPTGLAAGNTGQSLDYTTGGSVSSLGHTVEYRFDWDDGSMSSWSANTTVSHSWAAAGTYNVKAQARCSTHPAVESAWSTGLDVVISVVTETVSVPDTPTGPASGQTNTYHTFNTGGAVSSLGHTVQYRFDLDGQISSWGTSTSKSHSWSTPGTYEVKAQARCQDHPAVESAWSAAASIDITQMEFVYRPTITTFTPLQELGTESIFQCTGASSNLGHAIEYQYDYGDGTISAWSASADGAHTYAAVGTYDVQVKARCVQHPSVDTAPSDRVETTIYVGAETVTTPTFYAPDEEDRMTWIGRNVSLGISAVNTYGHDLQFRFDLGEGTITPWSNGSNYTTSYATFGDYLVKGQARCRDHTDIESAWSDPITIRIIEWINKPEVDGPTHGVVEVPVTFTTTGTTSNEGHALEYQFYIVTSTSNLNSGFGPQGWSSAMELEFTFPANQAGRYYILVRARCATHTHAESFISSYHSILISNY